MSRHLHHVVNNDVSRTLFDIQKMGNEEAQQVYGIEIREDGTVFDPTYNQSFSSIGEWAEYSAEYDEMDYLEQFGHGKQTYDDFY